MVHERPSNTNEALEKVTKVNPVEIKKEPGVQITRCQCVECPELVKNNKIKTLLLSFADINSDFIISLNKILNPESPREYFEKEDESITVKTEPVTVKLEPLTVKTEPDTVKTEPDDTVKTEPDKVKTKPRNEPEDNIQAIRKRKHEGQYENMSFSKRLKAEELVTLDEAVMENNAARENVSDEVKTAAVLNQSSLGAANPSGKQKVEFDERQKLMIKSQMLAYRMLRRKERLPEVVFNAATNKNFRNSTSHSKTDLSHLSSLFKKEYSNLKR